MGGKGKWVKDWQAEVALVKTLVEGRKRACVDVIRDQAGEISVERV